ncbi:MAG: FmdB family transcriptional regulator [Chloroflexi bacterium]|nr:MAG: FmdB family transcriptional regulator [Chloroflexota bacterium]TME86817.1 MAG: FmdB family transcriptional regulator [Chloroflexota bacterium]
MPIYDYRCDHCGHVFSAVQSFNDEALEKCPNCGKKPRRLISTPAIVFKGSGWYKTDSRPADKTSDVSADKKSETKTETKTETKSETKADKKSETKAPEKPASKSDGGSKSDAAS